MLCEVCGKKEATHLAVSMKREKKTRAMVCADCARKQGWEEVSEAVPVTEENVMASLIKQSEAEGTKALPKLKCTHCDLSYEDFRQFGRLGCSKCYETFSDSLKDLLRRIHGRNDHVGKVPRSFREKFLTRREIKKLQGQIKKAVENEEFEKAAVMRDQIKRLELKEAAEKTKEGSS
jgi:protein arginine kinase activator